MSKELTIAVLTGNHSYPIRPFHDFFRNLDGVNAYIQNFDEWLTAAGENGDHQIEHDAYDVTLFYTMLRGALEGKAKESINHLFESGQPVFFLHHAILNGLSRINGSLEPAAGEPWSEIMGLPERGITLDEWLAWIGPYKVNVSKEDPAAIGLDDFEITDEIYGIGDCTDECDVLLTTSKKESMHTLAWSKIYNNSRVFCMQLGHDARCWENPAFQTLMKNGLRWCVGDLG